MVGTDEVLDLGRVQGKVVIAEAVPHSGPRQRDLMMGLRQLLRVVGAAHQRIIPGLTQTSLEQVQDNLRILRIVFILGVVHRLASAGQRHSGNRPQLEALSAKKIRQRTMIVAGRFETDQRGRIELAQVGDQPLVLLQRVGTRKRR